MNVSIEPKKMNGLYEIFPEVFYDDRGFLARMYDDRIFSKLGIAVRWTEQSHHHTARKYILRGLHMSLPPYSEGKLLRVIRGEMLWVSVDVRTKSETFGCWDSIVLSESKKNLLFATRGFAHGCLSLTDSVDLIINSDNYFSDEHGMGIIWHDTDLNIDWQLNGAKPTVSERDRGYSSFAEFRKRTAETL